MKGFFQKLAALTISSWKWILWAFLFLVIAGGFFSALLFENLKVSWVDMVPKETPLVEMYQSITKDFVSASGIVITVQGKNRNGVEKAIAAVGPELQKRKDLFRSVQYRNDQKFQGRFALLLQKAKDLKRNAGYLSKPGLVHFLTGINDSLESEYVGNADNMKQNENDIALFITGLEDLGELIRQAGKGPYTEPLLQRNAAFFTTGPAYQISPDGKMGLIIVAPMVSIDDIYGSVRVANELDAVLARLGKEHPGISFGQTGMHTITRDEMKAAGEDSMVVTFLAFILIVIFLIAAFRMKSAPILGMVTLLVGIILALGLAWFLVGSLNMMTVMVGAILMGLGIDYSVHILSRFTEAREAGSDAPEAVRAALNDSGRGLVTGALTTAAAFGVLMLIPFEGLAQLGVMAAIGVLSCMATSLVLLPSLLMLRERVITRKKHKKEKKVQLPMRYTFLATMERRVNRKPLITVILVLGFTVWMAFQLPKAVFTGDLKEVEMKGLASLVLNDVIQEKFDMTADSVFMISKTMEEDRKYRKILEDNPQISMVESPSLYLPSADQQQQRVAVMRRIGAALAAYRLPAAVDRDALAKELLRLKANVLEMRDLAYTSGLDRVFKRATRLLGGKKRESRGILDAAADSVRGKGAGSLDALSRGFSAALRGRILPMTRVSGITRVDLPEEIRSRVFSRDGKKGLITAWLMKNNWDTLHKSPFLDNLVKTTDGKVTGLILFMRELVQVASREGGRATLLALGAIMLIILLDFRSFRMGGLAVLNLVAVVVSMVGLFIILDNKFNFMNVLALPLLIGIGIDDSVHILHRFRKEEGLASVLASTGRGVLLTSLTTMFGFGSLVFAKFQGFQSFGLLLFFGVGIAFVYSVLFLPALIRLFPGRGRTNID